MVSFRERIEAECEAIEETLSLLPDRELDELSELEIAGVASLIHNFYNGVENILKQVFRAKGIKIPRGSSWHRDLLLGAVENDIIPQQLADWLKEYLAFRHFFSHGYAIDLNPERLGPLVADIGEVYNDLQQVINQDFFD